MQKEIAIGLLLPSSTILKIGKDFEAGVKRGLKKLTTSADWQIEFILEFIAEGSKEKVEAAINKLISFHGVDLVTGIVSNRSAMHVSEKFEKHKKPFILNNIGEHVPDPKFFNRSVYLNSTHTWQQVWSVGNWAVKNIGKKGMFVSGIYDAGYSFTMMLQLGMHAADPSSIMPFAIATTLTPGALADVESVFKHIEEFKPDFIFAAFCGEEASIFLNEYTSRGLHKTTPLLGLPFLLQPFESKGEEIIVYTPVSTTTTINTSYLNGLGEISDNPYPQLGYETGLLICEALTKGSTAQLFQTLDTLDVEGARGKLNILSHEPGKNNLVYLIKNSFDGHTNTKEIINKLETVTINNQALTTALENPSSGWFNPYLGV